MHNPYDMPILHGEDNEYGDYDYLVDGLPQNVEKWNLSRTAWKCDACGHYRHFRFITRYFFYTLDGYDSSDCDVCWTCMLRSAVKMAWLRIKKDVKALWVALMVAINAESGWKLGMFRAALKIMRER